MLTKTDLKQIETIFDKRISNVETKISGLDNKLSSVEKKLSSVEKRLSKQLKSIKKDTKYAVSFLDKDQLNTENRVKRIEKHLQLPEIPYITT